MKIGITGTICSGKSHVARLLGRLLCVDVLDSDMICRELLEKEKQGWLGLTEKWGEYFLTASREVDRPKLRKAIFDDDKVRQELERILHPLVRQEIKEIAEQKSESGDNLLVEVPLLFEVGWQCDFDRTVLVYASQGVCLERVMARDGVSRIDGEKILASQMNVRQKIPLADSVIDNSGCWSRTVVQIYHLSAVLRALDNK